MPRAPRPTKGMSQLAHADAPSFYTGIGLTAELVHELDSRAPTLGVPRSALIDEALRLYLGLPWAESRIARRHRMRKYMRRYHDKHRPAPAPVPQASADLPPLGALLVDDDGSRVQCHACGRWYAHVGMHARAHGLDADSYRAEYGLARGVSLAAPVVQARNRELAIAKQAAGKLNTGDALAPRPRSPGTPNRLSSKITSSKHSARGLPHSPAS